MKLQKKNEKRNVSVFNCLIWKIYCLSGNRAVEKTSAAASRHENDRWRLKCRLKLASNGGWKEHVSSSNSEFKNEIKKKRFFLSKLWSSSRFQDGLRLTCLPTVRRGQKVSAVPHRYATSVYLPYLYKSVTTLASIEGGKRRINCTSVYTFL